MSTPSTPDCCEVWPQIRGRFGWFDFEDEPTVSAMPSLFGEGQHWRVNYCPSCGAPRRSTIWNRSAELEGQPCP
jgi:hypothetical protein